MTIEKIEKKIELLLQSEKRWPVVTDFSNKKDMNDFIHHFDVGANRIISAGNYCGNDEPLKYEELLNCIESNVENIFLVHLSAYLKLDGEAELKNRIKSLLSKTISGHVIIVTYQCRNYLKYTDSRFAERGQIMIADGEFDDTPQIKMISPELSEAFSHVYSGFEKIGDAYENSKDAEVYIATNVGKQLYERSIISVSSLNNGYEIMCAREPGIKNVPESYGTPEQWRVLLKLLGSNRMSRIMETQFGNADDMIRVLHDYPDYSDTKKWICYIALSIYGAKKDSYVSLANSYTTGYLDIPRALFRTILSVDRTDEDFARLYAERKEILKSFRGFISELVDYCKIVSVKEEDAIYYLTDLSRQEKEKIIEWLDIYGKNYSANELIRILDPVYPDLADYLSVYHFQDELLNDYFEKYKYQKLINKLLPEFKQFVEEQSGEMRFVGSLKPRTQIFDKIDLKNTQVYFLDALGAEYLGFIQNKTQEYDLSINIMYGRCELPSLTKYNTEFLGSCDSKGCVVSNIKNLDEIKHHGEDSCDYEKTKTPVYLIRELEIIDELLLSIRAQLLNDKYEKAVIVSDHGTSRLAVLNESENNWEMETKGVHSGRCCPKNEINTKPDFAIEQSGYWVLANYDRFKGGRRANVEVHGGATIEEVTVPIIEISKKDKSIEAFIPDAYKVITLSAKEIPVLRIYVGMTGDHLSVKVGDHYYAARPTEQKYIYETEVTDCTKKGIYFADILNGSEVLSSDR